MVTTASFVVAKNHLFLAQILDDPQHFAEMTEILATGETSSTAPIINNEQRVCNVLC